MGHETSPRLDFLFNINAARLLELYARGCERCDLRDPGQRARGGPVLRDRDRGRCSPSRRELSPGVSRYDAGMNVGTALIMASVFAASGSFSGGGGGGVRNVKADKRASRDRKSKRKDQRKARRKNAPTRACF